MFTFDIFAIHIVTIALPQETWINRTKLPPDMTNQEYYPTVSLRLKSCQKTVNIGFPRIGWPGMSRKSCSAP